jgi:hypothetical protein
LQRISYPLTALIGYGGLYLCFLVLSFVSGRTTQIYVVQLGGVAGIVSLTEAVWPVFLRFLLHFWSQIYTTPLFFPRHAPSNHAPRHLPLQSPEAWATVVVGVRRVACTRQRARCSLACVTATPHFFWPRTVLVKVYGG